MAFIPPLAFGKAFILAQLTVCPPPSQAPHADVFFMPQKPDYITQAPVKALTEANRGNPDSTIATDSKWFVEGLTSIDLSRTQFNVSFDMIHDQAGNTCLYVDKVNFIVAYTPTIFLAKELSAPGRECQYHMVKLHEERHVATDHATITEYVPKVKMDVLWYLRSLGPQGPYPESQIPVEYKRIVHEVEKATEPVMQKLIEVRRARQGSIDTIENYKQESALCPDEAPPVPDPDAK